MGKPGIQGSAKTQTAKLELTVSLRIPAKMKKIYDELSAFERHTAQHAMRVALAKFLHRQNFDESEWLGDETAQ